MNELVRLRFSSILFYGLCTLMLVISVVSFINAYSLINKPFPGFFIYKFPRVASLGSRNWPGPQAGLRFMERIVSADGQPITQGPDVVAMARQKPLGTPIEYAVESAGEIRTVVVPTAKFSVKDFFSVFFSTFTCGFIIFCLYT